MNNQNVFPRNLEGMMIFFCSICFQNILVKSKLVSKYSFKVLNMLINIKSSMNRECFKSLKLAQFFSENLFRTLGHLEPSQENLEKRESLFEAVGICFLSDHLDSYIENSHLIINKIMQDANSPNLNKSVGFSFNNSFC